LLNQCGSLILAPASDLLPAHHLLSDVVYRHGLQPQ
jgi:hypothetical protein